MTMRDIHMDVRLPFRTPEDRRASEHILCGLLGFNALVNLRYLDANPATPRLYDSNVQYAPPDQTNRPPIEKAKLQALVALLQSMSQDAETISLITRILRGVEVFLDVPSLYGRGKGDCNELAPVRVAELWQAGVDASPHLIKERNGSGGWTYHAVVKWPDGSQEDPSLILGMGGQARAAERREEIRKNAERWATHMMAAREVIAEHGISPTQLGHQIDLLGLLPKDGVFRVGGGPIDCLGWMRRKAAPRYRSAS